MDEQVIEGLEPQSFLPDSDPSGPPLPATTEDTGLTEGMISDLVLKTLYAQGARSGEQRRQSISWAGPWIRLEPPKSIRIA